MKKKALYNIPTVSADSSSTAMNMDFMKEETYPCTSEGCAKEFYLRENLTKHAKLHEQEEEKCRTKRKRAMNEHENAMKEVNNAL